MKLKKGVALLLTSLLLLCTGCFSDRSTRSDGDADLLPDSSLTEQTFTPPGRVIAYEYPADQAQALKDALDRAVAAGGVDFTVGEVNAWEDAYGKRREIPVYWRGERAHSCLISFYTPLSNSFGSLRAARDDVSFTIAFQDPEAMEDMITIAIPVIQHIEPSLSWTVALAVAENLLDTLTVDGFGDPMDIGGYQLQLHYTNPHIFFSSDGFIANMGLSCDALATIWGEFDTSGYHEMTPALYSAAGRDGSPASARVTGTITEWYKQLDYYGTPETFVTVAYGEGNSCLLRMNWPGSPYEFALGGEYEFYVMLNHPRGPALVYAIQLGMPG